MHAPAFPEPDTTGEQGEIYLLHFHQPLSRAKHYLGWAKDHEERVKKHRGGYSRVGLMNALHAKGIGFDVAQVWSGTRNDERKLKNRKSATRFCPICVNERKQKSKKKTKNAKSTRRKSTKRLPRPRD